MSGNSVLSALVAIAIGTVGFLIMQQATSNGMLASKEITMKAKRLQLRREIQNALDTAACKESFAGKILDRSLVGVMQTANGLSPTTTVIKNAAGETLATAGLKLNGMVISSLGVRLDRFAGQVAVGRLVLDIVKTSAGAKASTGDKAYHDEFTVTFNLQSTGAISDCRTTSESTNFYISTNLVQQYDSGTNHCADFPNYWHYATACDRYCSTGCTTADPGCTANLPGLGYSTGIPGECNGAGQMMECTCIP